MPPAPLRRPLTVTTWLLASSLGLLLSPLLLALGALASALLRRPQPLLVTRLFLAYFARELGVLIACGALWLLSACGLAIRRPRVRRAHYRLLDWFVHGLARRVIELLRLTIAPEPTREAGEALVSDRPLLLFSRHAGPGDTLLLVDELVTRYRRLPSIVFKDTLTIDPTVDIIGHRLPHAILDTAGGEAAEREIAQVAAGLGPRGVLVLFPEGGNFTPERRSAALRSLRRKGRRREARAAAAMTHMLPPRPSGALAAMRGNPEADIVFAAHTGLGLAAFPRELWKHTPFGGTLRMRMWLASAEEVPADERERVAWLYDWWARLDRWVEEEGERAPAPALPPP